MSEEEKKVIENIKHIIKHWQPPKEDKLATIEYKSIKKLYEIYNKQQKEIEELKNTKPKYIVGFKELKEVEDFKNLYISKDKINKKIEKIDLFDIEKINREGYDAIEFAIEILIELLEE